MNLKHPPLYATLGSIAACLCALSLPTTSVHAAPAQKAAHTDGTAATPKKSRSTKVKLPPTQAGESPAERDRRLYRECKGLPNAGACLGYARR